MNPTFVSSSAPILLVGGAHGDNSQLIDLLARHQTVVGVDSGADWCQKLGRIPDALIGDLDSVSQEVRARIPQDRVIHIAEQDSTDFDKALRSVVAPCIVGIGFLGAQVDHTLAALTVLARYRHRRVLLLGRQDVVLHLPPRLSMDLPKGARVSLFPLAEVTGRSEGLEWPINGLTMAPAGRVGTSNRVSSGPVSLEMDGPGMLLILPVSSWVVGQSALDACADLWPAP